MKTVILAAALAGLAAPPALAAGPVGPARAAAIQACSAAAQKYTEYTWGNMEIFVYRACAAERRQAE
jgi:hypothetical protein